jgi:hypothetical protein
MEQYVLLYHFEDQESEKHFAEKIRQHFGRHKVERNGETTYFGFTGQEEPGVVGQIKSSIDTLGIGTSDYVALYFSKQEAGPEKITQKMLLGSDDLVESNIRTVSAAAHVDTLTRLLDFDYVEAQPEPPQ